MSDRPYKPKRSATPYTKEFNAYWGRVDSYIGSGMEGWQSARVKRLAFNAWKAGKKAALKGGDDE